MKKVAIIFDGDLDDRKGQFNAAFSRAKHLRQISDFDIDVFLISVYEPWIIRKLLSTRKKDRVSSVELEGITLNVIWENFSVLDKVLFYKLHTIPVMRELFIRRILRKFKGYDLICAHSSFAGRIAYLLKRKQGVPFTVTWHGSDIHRFPFENKYSRLATVKTMEAADVNFFVSRKLLETSDELTKSGRKEVLYNGVGEEFRPLPREIVESFKEEHGSKGRKIVAFCGNIVPVKNVLALPGIFRHIHEKDKDVIFWIIGDGKLRAELESMSKGLPVVFWGNQKPEMMPLLMNCVDVLAVPSKNEGLGLAAIEALSCGRAVVGSRVGGIPEVIGTENTVPLEAENFERDFAEKVLEYLRGGESGQSLDGRFSWDKTAAAELDIINGLLK